jgi:hypothetical protein
MPFPQGYRSKVESRHFAHHWGGGTKKGGKTADKKIFTEKEGIRPSYIQREI